MVRSKVIQALREEIEIQRDLGLREEIQRDPGLA